MFTDLSLWLLPCFFVIAFLHSSVGLAGGSSYTAFMAVFGVPTHIIPSISLALNTLVSSISTFNFTKNQHLVWSLLWPFLLTSIPMTALGAQVQLPKLGFYLVLLVTLLVCLLRMMQRIHLHHGATNAAQTTRSMSIALSDYQRIAASLLIGTGLGFLAGCVGIGGGIYLVPMLLLLGIADAKQAAACAAVFILINSIIGLLSKWQLGLMTPSIWPALCCVGIGGALGSWQGARFWPVPRLEKALALTLALACILLALKIVQTLSA